MPLPSTKEQKEAKVVEGNHKKGEKQQQREGMGERRRLFYFQQVFDGE